jgi:uncharacterized protein YecA (UPF0149 family)
MDTRTGDIYTSEQLDKIFREKSDISKFIKEMKLEPTVLQKSRKPINPNAIGRVGRNESCPCGSGKKFKKCCLIKKVEK